MNTQTFAVSASADDTLHAVREAIAHLPPDLATPLAERALADMLGAVAPRIGEAAAGAPAQAGDLLDAAAEHALTTILPLALGPQWTALNAALQIGVRALYHALRVRAVRVEADGSELRVVVER